MQPPPRPPDTSQRQPMQPQAGYPNAPAHQPGFQEDWAQGQEPQQYQGMDQQFGEAEAELQPYARLPKIIVGVLLAIGILMVLRFQVFTIRNVNVQGLVNIPWQTAASNAGLDQSPFYFTLSEDKVREGINKNRYLVFESMTKIFPNTVILKLQERKPFAFFTHLGLGYVLAQDGMVLEQTRELKDGEGLIQVQGLSVWGQQAPGTFPSSTDPSQAEVLVALFHELQTWGFDSQVVSIDVSQSLYLSLQTRDGYTVNLGSSEYLHAKVGTVTSVVGELRRRLMTGGIIEATLPGEATYLAAQQNGA